MLDACCFLASRTDATLVRTQEERDTLRLNEDEVRKRNAIGAVTVNIAVHRAVVGTAVVLSVVVDDTAISIAPAHVVIACTSVLGACVARLCASRASLIRSGQYAGEGIRRACRSHSGACHRPTRAVAVFFRSETTMQYAFVYAISGSKSEAV